eukprot:gene6739-13647_t
MIATIPMSFDKEEVSHALEASRLPAFDQVFGKLLADLDKEMKASNKNADISSDEDENHEKDQINTGRWTNEEHQYFLEGINKYGNNWVEIRNLIKTRTLVQIRTHAQKIFKAAGGVRTLDPDDNDLEEPSKRSHSRSTTPTQDKSPIDFSSIHKLTPLRSERMTTRSSSGGGNEHHRMKAYIEAIRKHNEYLDSSTKTPLKKRYKRKE